MGDISSEENQVKILLEEYKLFREEILHKISAYSKNIYIFSSATLILFGVGIKGDFNQIFVPLPFIISTGHLLIMQDFRWLCRLAKYNQVVEEKINMLVDVDYKIMYWEHLSGDWSQEKILYQLAYNTALYLPVILIYWYAAYKGAQFVDTYFYCEYNSIFIGCMLMYSILFIYCIVLFYHIFLSNEGTLKNIKIKMNIHPQTTTQNKQ